MPELGRRRFLGGLLALGASLVQACLGDRQRVMPPPVVPPPSPAATGPVAGSPSPVIRVSPGPAPRDNPIEHVVVIYLENHTFDNLYGLFPGANGINSPGAKVPQVDRNGQVYQSLPRPAISLDWAGLGQPLDLLPGLPDPRFPASLPNEPFGLSQYVPDTQLVGSPVHRFYEHQLQMNGGRMDKFVAWTDSGGLVMGYYDTPKLPLYPYAREFVLCDNFFTAAFGGSFLNHIWLVAARTPDWPNAPADAREKPMFDAQGRLIGVQDSEGANCTPDGYAVNTGVESFYPPHSANTPVDRLLPPQAFPTIGDRLSAAGITWAEYCGGWNDALAGQIEQPVPLIPMPPMSSFSYFQPYGPGTDARANHIRDLTRFLPDVIAGQMPSVVILKPDPANDCHPGYSIVQTCENWVVSTIEAIRLSPYWNKTAIVITYDDFGGWYDHVAPPVIDRWGPGGRVPALIISPHAKRGFVDHTLYDTTSILRFIEWRFGLPPLTDRDARANNLTNAFTFG